jgi:hypothetical protein
MDALTRSNFDGSGLPERGLAAPPPGASTRPAIRGHLLAGPSNLRNSGTGASRADLTGLDLTDPSGIVT